MALTPTQCRWLEAEFGRRFTLKDGSFNEWSTNIQAHWDNRQVIDAIKRIWDTHGEGKLQRAKQDRIQQVWDLVVNL